VLELSELYKKYNRKEGYAVKGVSLKVERGELLALVGESGSGKTTLLRMIAGFEIPEKGQIHLNHLCVVGPRSFVNPEKRKIGMVFQDYALFPHLTVYQNIIFGLRHLDKDQKKERAEQVLQLVGLQQFGARYPHQLSGGQQQRTALARALAPQPDLILLDEPFSNLDGLLKEQVRKDMRDILKKTGSTAIFVTHDTKDALATADRIAILKNGEIEQTGSSKELYEKPVNAYVASFFGQINLFEAKPSKGGFQTALGHISLPEPPESQEQEVFLSIRPEHINYCAPGKGQYCGHVQELTYMGEYLQVSLLMENSLSLVLKVKPDHALRLNDLIYFGIQPEKIHVMTKTA
jgi:iron(III) transport system ATP-binding protein